MALSQRALAAIGDITIQTTFLELFMAQLARMGGETEDEMVLLLRPHDELVKCAKQSTIKIDDADLAKRTAAWLDKAEKLRDLRNKLVHSLVLHVARRNWMAYHPRSDKITHYRTAEIVDIASQIHAHADEGNWMCIWEWPVGLGLVGAEQLDAEDE